MKVSILSYLRCPCCLGLNLEVNDNIFQIKESDDSIIEGTISCKGCRKDYPVLLGLPLLLQELSHYATKNKPEILLNLHKFKASKQALEYINDIAAHSIYGYSASQESWQSQEGIDTYIHNQYVLELNTCDNHFTPPFEPYNYYKHISSLINQGANDDVECLIDLGCGTGGMLYYLRNAYSQAIGLDYSFSALLSAQRIQTGVPNLKDSYNYYVSAQRVVKRIISCVNSSDVHFVVGDATAPPLRESIADIVTCINLLEIVKDPVSLLSGIKTILKSNGLLANSSAYYWRDDRSAKDLWPTDSGESESAAFMQLLDEMQFKLVNSIDRIPWPFRIYDRYWQIWDSHLLLVENSD